MCGILFTNSGCINLNQFKKALQLMNHRGPDATGCVLTNNGCKLGHDRLKILDISDKANQPFYSKSKKHLIVYNGEIYNYKELSKKYRISLTTNCDTELLVELYEKIGSKMLDDLNGMFAFVIFNLDNEEIFIARDRLGIKPLYIYRNNSEFIISSEIAPILALTKKNDFDDIGMRQYKSLRTFFNCRTIYKNIKMFPAAHYMINSKLCRYWHLPEGHTSPPDDEELLYLIKSAVDYRCISDVSVGSYLSGGLDSSIIATLASKPNTWTVGFEDNNEFPWGELVSDNIRSVHRKILITHDEFLDLASKMVLYRHEPLSVPNEVLLYKMTMEVKKYNTVVLSGEGADELFFGYDRIFRWAENSKWNIEEFAKHYAYGNNPDFEIIEDVLSPYKKYNKAIEKVARFFQIDHLHGLLRRLDNSTMMCSVEARVPFVDHRLVERLAGVNYTYRMNNDIVKAPLKRVFENILPKEIIKRQKIGFPVPLNRIFKLDEKKGKKDGFDKWFKFNIDILKQFNFR